ncbi:hypothetical protein LIA77_09718 [Sarocladium implicatum]|nr:hypothetical protein LIA77_09718 [Sarocladium implicatum]
MAIQRLSILFLAFAGAGALAYKDIPLEVIPIVDPPPINTPTPLLLPVLPNCEQFHLINPGETCDGISSSLGMSVQSLKSLNPYFKTGSQTCAENLLAGYWMCVKTLSGDGKGDDGKNGNEVPKTTTAEDAAPILPPIKGIDGWLTKIRAGVPKAPKTQAPVTVTVPPPPKTAEPTLIIDVQHCIDIGQCEDWA